MINLIYNKNLYETMQPFMFSKKNMATGYMYKSVHVIEEVTIKEVAIKEVAIKEVAKSVKHIEKENVSLNITDVCSLPGFVPYQKDKLFWCFYILMYGYDEYELNRTNTFSVEKRIKIEAVEQLKTIKEKLKDLKLKRTELEHELVNLPTISVKGLHALCLIHDISITYVYGRCYCEINVNNNSKKGIIIQNEKKEDTLRWRVGDSSDSSHSSHSSNNDAAFYKKLQEEYWFIENVQKPLKAASAYTIKELQDISKRIQIDLYTTVSDKQKLKTKTKLYQEILQHV